MEESSYYDDERVIEKYAGYANDGLREGERYIIEEYFSDADATVLDLGCGTGRTTAPLSDYGYDVVGVDLSESLIEEARKAHPTLTFQVGDATDLAFPDESFQHVLFARMGIDEIPSKPQRMRALLEAWRVLEPGGVFAFDANNILRRFAFDPRSIEDWSRELRFLIRNSREGTVTSRYALIEYPNGIDVGHAILPRAQRRQLEDIGFDVLEIVTRSRPVHLDGRPFYVAQKPHDTAPL